MNTVGDDAVSPLFTKVPRLTSPGRGAARSRRKRELTLDFSFPILVFRCSARERSLPALLLLGIEQAKGRLEPVFGVCEPPTNRS